MIHQKDKVKYGTTTIPYHIIKTRRIKTSEVIVDAVTITVRTPLDKDTSEIRKLVLDKARWIIRKQKEYRETVPDLTKPSFKDNTTLLFLGKNYSLAINKKQTKNSLELVDEKFVVGTKSIRLSSKILKELYENWLREKAQQIFEYKVKEYSKKLEVEVRGIGIKNLKNRWGSLGKNGVINLNVNLLKAPEDIIDYIVLHELCHLKIKSHSHHFWYLIYKFMPNYYDRLEWLKANGTNLL